MSQTPKVSIIVPVYKVPENYLRKCIESIQAQTLKEVEVLLVDDGSPDNCGKICDEYAAGDRRIRVVHKENGGLSSARNAGFKTATSDWVMFVDGDDWIEPNMCWVLYQKGIENNVQLVMCSLWKDYGHTQIRYKHTLSDGYLYRGTECKWLQEQLLVYNANIAVAYCKLFRRDYLLKNNILHNEVLKQGAEGLEFNLRAFEHLNSAIFIDLPLYHYIYNENSISATTTEENNQLIVRCFETIKKFIQNSENRDSLEKWFNNRLKYVIVTTAISGYFNPLNILPYRERVIGIKSYVNNQMIKDAINSNMSEGISSERRFVLFAIKHHMYVSLYILGRIRSIQKKKR